MEWKVDVFINVTLQEDVQSMVSFQSGCEGCPACPQLLFAGAAGMEQFWGTAAAGASLG